MIAVLCSIMNKAMSGAQVVFQKAASDIVQGSPAEECDESRA